MARNGSHSNFSLVTGFSPPKRAFYEEHFRAEERNLIDSFTPGNSCYSSPFPLFFSPGPRPVSLWSRLYIITPLGRRDTCLCCSAARLLYGITSSTAVVVILLYPDFQIVLSRTTLDERSTSHLETVDQFSFYFLRGLKGWASTFLCSG